MDRRKELKLAYKMTPNPMGVYQLRNQINGKIFVASNMNLHGSSNRYHLQLNTKTHVNRALQEDWNLYGAEAFVFEVLETINAEEIPEANWRRAVAILEEKWLAALQPYGERGYNKQKP